LQALLESAAATRPGDVAGTSWRYAPVELLGEPRHYADAKAGDFGAGKIVVLWIAAAGKKRVLRLRNEVRHQFDTPQ
jgi:hypothetical protein